jgi:hypothetical protein
LKAVSIERFWYWRRPLGHDGAIAFFYQQTIGGQLEDFSLLGACIRNISGLAFYRDALRVFLHNVVGLGQECIAVRDNELSGAVAV